MERATTRLGDDPDLRASLPLGPDLTDLGSLAEEVAGARRALLRAIEELPDTEVLRVLRRRERAAQRPEPLGPLAQLAAAEELTADTVLRLREALLVDLLPGPEEGTVVVSSRAGRLTLESHHVPALRALLDARSGRVADLAADPATALDLGRRLVRHGLVLVDGGRLGD